MDIVDIVLKIVLKIDIDGVLLDSMDSIVKLFLRCFFEVFGIKIDSNTVRQQSHKFSGLTFEKIFSILVEQHSLIAEQSQIEECINKLNKGMENIINKAQLYSGAKETIKDLYGQGYILVISSALPKRLIEKLLEKHNLTEYFQLILSAQEDGKKGEEHIARIYREYPDSTIVGVGDSEVDAQGVKIFIWVYGARKDFIRTLRLTRVFKVPSFNEVPSIMLQIQEPNVAFD